MSDRIKFQPGTVVAALAAIDHPALVAEIDALKHDIERHVAIASEEAARTTWQPIETAPRDGTKVLAFMVDRAEVRKGFEPQELDGVDVIYWTNTGDGGWECHRFGSPTHWMPLPAPPTA